MTSGVIQLKEKVRQTITKPKAVGAFHALPGRLVLSTTVTSRNYAFHK